MSKMIESLILALFGIFVLTASAVTNVSAADNPFAVPQSATDLHLAAGENKCETGKCQTGKCKGAPSRSSGKSSESMAELKSLCAQKIRGGFCGAGKCATGKCGQSLKDTCASMMEGKCGEAR